MRRPRFAPWGGVYNPVLMPAPAVGVSEPQAKSMFRDALDALRAGLRLLASFNGSDHK